MLTSTLRRLGAQRTGRALRSTARLPSPRSRRPGVRALRAAWTAPTNALGHLAGWLVSGQRGARMTSPYAQATLYPIRWPGLGWIRAVTLGHAVLHQPGMFDHLRGRLVLVHELAHTRQHDVLGPAYLPLHAVLQMASAVRFAFAPAHGSDAVHAYNPLEQRWLCLGAGAYKELARGQRWSEQEVRALLDAFGVGPP